MKAPTRTKTFLGRLLAVSAVIVLAACSREMQDLDKYVADVQAQKPRPIEPIPEMKPFESYQYPAETEGLRNPFQPLGFGEETAAATASDAGEGGGPKPDPTRPKEALEDYPLDSLSYVGTLAQQRDSWALIRDPDGTVHRVSTGNYLGQNHGRIVAITPQEIRLRELVRKPNGGWLERTNSIALRDGQS